MAQSTYRFWNIFFNSSRVEIVDPRADDLYQWNLKVGEKNFRKHYFQNDLPEIEPKFKYYYFKLEITLKKNFP